MTARTKAIAKPVAETIDDYIAAVPKDVQAQLQDVRRAIARAAPQANEAISSGGAGFSPEMARYASGKATLKFPLDEPLPLDLIAKVVKAKLRLATAPKKRVTRA